MPNTHGVPGPVTSSLSDLLAFSQPAGGGGGGGHIVVVGDSGDDGVDLDDYRQRSERGSSAQESLRPPAYLVPSRPAGSSQREDSSTARVIEQMDVEQIRSRLEELAQLKAALMSQAHGLPQPALDTVAPEQVEDALHDQVNDAHNFGLSGAARRAYQDGEDAHLERGT